MNSPLPRALDPLGITRRHFFAQAGRGLGVAALASLLSRTSGAAGSPGSLPNFAPRAKRIIYLFQSGAPSQIDLFDHKPVLRERNGEQLPDHVRGNQRLTGMTAQQSSLPLAGSAFDFARCGRSGTWLSELLPFTGAVADDLCVIRSMFTEAINHDPAITYFQTGSQIAGRPSMGAWIHYGLGSMNENLPAFIVLVTAQKGDQPLYSRLWGNGFLESRFQGVRFRSGKDPILYLSNAEGPGFTGRRGMLDTINSLNRLQFERELDPEIESRIAQYEMAYRMQTSVPEAVDLSTEPESTFELYGPDSRKPGTFAANCLLARRLAERGVRFIQLYHQGWDQHDNLPGGIAVQARETDQPSAALIKDLKQRGLLDDTLVVWGGEFGRTCYSQGKLTRDNYGRDHHPRSFSIWLAGGGVKGGLSYGRTDDYGYNIVDAEGNPLNPDRNVFKPGAVHVHDLQATLLHLLGIDHKQLSYVHQGRRFQLTDVHGHVVTDILG
ncbi:MAG TPA: sulfatase [Verrucomicrobiales bacterium]|nr:sulfatase [Verrucomicrobiales bacterium]